MMILWFFHRRFLPHFLYSCILHPSKRGSADFIRSLYDGLTANGLVRLFPSTGDDFCHRSNNSLKCFDSLLTFSLAKIVVQVGELPSHSDPPDELSTFYNRAHMMIKLKEVGFHTIHTYTEGHCHFFSPWQFIVAFKNIHTSVNWFRDEAEVELKLHQRLHRTKSGKPILQYFDGHVMRHYQSPSKVITTNNCRSSEDDNELKCSTSKEPTTLKLHAQQWDGLVSVLNVYPLGIVARGDDGVISGMQHQLDFLLQQLNVHLLNTYGPS